MEPIQSMLNTGHRENKFHRIPYGIAEEKYFIPFKKSVLALALPEKFILQNSPHALAVEAALDLQDYLQTNKDWEHNFGLIPGQKGKVIGKMFGVLVVRTEQNDLGYIAAFSGKLANSNKHTKFVPPIFDTLCPESFVTDGMKKLSQINFEIKNLEATVPADYEKRILTLKSNRKNYSILLQQKIFDQYFFLNQSGDEKSLKELFQKASYKNPPSGAGECAGPKLLQYAFRHRLTPITLTEFWWGLSPKSAQWQHGYFYPCCKEKCQPILKHMLKGLE